MNNNPQFSKRCYRCPNLVRMTPQEFRASDGPFATETCCPVCRDKINVEAGFAGTQIPRARKPRNEFPKELSTPPALPAPTT